VSSTEESEGQNDDYCNDQDDEHRHQRSNEVTEVFHPQSLGEHTEDMYRKVELWLGQREAP
jgi:hypothetical protein